MKRTISALAAGFAVLFAAQAADAAVRHEGTWPESEKKVTLDVSGAPRSEAIRKLGEAAGWSIVVQAPPGDPVDIHVKDQSAGKVLDLLLTDTDYVARRDGTLVAIERVQGPRFPGSADVVAPVPSGMPLAPAAPMPPSPPAPFGSTPTDPGSLKIDPETAKQIAEDTKEAIDQAKADAEEARRDAEEARREAKDEAKRKRRGAKINVNDRTVFGGSVKIEKGESVDDVSVFGGTVDVYGTVHGDISVLGGAVTIRPGAAVTGDISCLGGQVTIEDDATVNGDVSALGGKVEKSPKAHVGGSVESSDIASAVEKSDGEDSDKVAKVSSFADRIFDGFVSRVSVAALFFMFGAVLIALAGPRMETLKLEVASRTMRSFALGVVGALATMALLTALCVTIIGIPVAVVGSTLLALAVFAGMVAVLTTFGEVLVRHKTENPYAHLAVGCGLFLVLGAIPVLGGVLKAFVILVAIGTLVATRGAGLVPKSFMRRTPSYPPAPEPGV
ncbi:MAG: hypothetical protein U0169_17480 [Polyangiaceae bacterium]